MRVARWNDALRAPAAGTVGVAGTVALVMMIAAAAGWSLEADPHVALSRAVSSAPVVAGCCVLLMVIASAAHLVAHRRLVWLVAGIPGAVVLVSLALVAVGLASTDTFDGWFLAAMCGTVVIVLGGPLTVLTGVGLLLPRRARMPALVLGAVFVGASAVGGILTLQS